VDFTLLNDNRGTYFGLVVGRDSTTSDIAAGSFKCALPILSPSDSMTD